ncbi:acyltransferase [Prevotella communis]|uniref:acyltransferase n=1 Tax=Prevotella communis TaxID=2913614 RepID=UPI003D69EB22
MKQRVWYFDILNVVACICVVCLHCNGFVHSFIKDSWWWLRVLVEVVCFFAVPVFFMLSGATLLNYRKKYTTTTFFKKRFTRTFIPFIFWSIFFYSLYISCHGTDLLSWREVLKNICTGKIPLTNYWFFIDLFLIYAFMPFLSILKQAMSMKQIMYLCLLLGLFQTVIPTVFYFTNIQVDISFPIGGYAIYVFVGYYLSHSTIETDDLWMTLLGAIALVSLTGRYVLVYFSESENPALFSYLGPYAIFPAIFIFLLFKRLFTINEKNHRICTFLSSKSLGVYLIHTFLISIIGKVINREEVVFIPISIIIVYLSSVLLVYLLQKNKYLKYLVP